MGDFLDLVDELIKQRLATVALVVAAKKKSAEVRLRGLTRGLDAERSALLLAARSYQRWSSDHDEPTPCPVCGAQGWLQCGLIDGEPESDGEGSIFVSQTAFPTAFECTVCGLALDGTDELAVFGLENDIELESRECDESDYDPPDHMDER